MKIKNQLVVRALQRFVFGVIGGLLAIYFLRANFLELLPYLFLFVLMITAGGIIYDMFVNKM